MGRILLSKDPLPQDNHGIWNKPKNVGVVLSICGKKNLTTTGAGMRIGQKHEIARMGGIEENER